MALTNQTPAERQAALRRQAVGEAVQEIVNSGDVLAAMRSGSPTSFGDAGLNGRFNEDGEFEEFFTVGMEVGSAPLQPDY